MSTVEEHLVASRFAYTIRDYPLRSTWKGGLDSETACCNVERGRVQHVSKYGTNGRVTDRSLVSLFDVFSRYLELFLNYHLTKEPGSALKASQKLGDLFVSLLDGSGNRDSGSMLLGCLFSPCLGGHVLAEDCSFFSLFVQDLL